MNRRAILALSLIFVATGCGADEPSPQMSPVSTDDEGPGVHVQMHKSPGCGCCAVWAEHLQAHGFEVESISDPNVEALKSQLGIPTAARSCHTAMIGEYVIEGHVPAGDIIRLLKEKPADLKGLSVPGMPLGSPGMEHPRPQPFQTVALMKDGTIQVYAEHQPGEDFSPSPPSDDESD